VRHIWVDQTKLIAVIAVISIHATTGLYEAFGNISLGDWWFANTLMTTGTAIANPIFVMLSGYLLLGRPTDTSAFFQTKAKRLFPAIIFWSIFYTLFSYIFFSASLMDSLWRMTAGLLLTGKVYFHLWYLSMFICLMSMTPFINQWICGVKPELKDIKILFAIFSFFMAMNFLSLCKENLAGNEISWFKSFTWYLIYFIAGFYLGKSELQKNLSTRLLIIVFCTTLCTCIGLNYLAIQHGITNIAFICANNGIFGFILALSAFCIFTRMAQGKSTNKTLETWAATSFGIYLIHPAILYFVQTVTNRFFGAKIVQTLFAIIFTFIFSALFVYVMRKTKAGQIIT
jgi:surface polysaccharide O-acyltransferase-like enzyme